MNNIVAFPVKTQEEQPKKKRKRGERADGLIQRSWQYIRLDNGERDREYFYGHSGAEADRKKDAFKKTYYEEKEALEKKKKELEELGPMAEFIGITVEEWIPIWRLKYKAKQGISSKQSYDACLTRISRHIGKMKVDDVREFHILDIFNDLDGYSESMIRKVFFILQSLFKKAKINKLIRENPMENFDSDELPEGTAGTHRSLEKWERELIFKWAKYHRAITWGACMILSGMRSGELAALDCKNVLLNERKLKIIDSVAYEHNQPVKQDQTKTEAGMRVVPICDLLHNIMLPLVEGKGPDDPVFTQANGKRITKTGFRKGVETMNNILTRLANGKGPSSYDIKYHKLAPPLLKENAKSWEIKRHERNVEKYRAKIEMLEKEEASEIKVNIRKHDFRFDFATALYDSGIMARDIKTAQYLLGHKDIKTTMAIYAQLTEERKKKSASEMVNFLDQWTSEMGVNLIKWCKNDVKLEPNTNNTYKT